MDSLLCGYLRNNKRDVLTFVVDTEATTAGGKVTSAPIDCYKTGGVFRTNIYISWGDGTSTIVPSGSSDLSLLEHEYASAGVYAVNITAENMKDVFFVGSNPNDGVHTIPHTQYFRETLISIGPLGAERYSLPFMQINPYSFFYECRHLRRIPEGLFDKWTHCVGFGNAFNGCTSITEVPEDLFKYNTEVLTFENCFSNIPNLKSVPENLFSANTKATNFSYLFYYSTGLSVVPVNLFRENKEALTFAGTFCGCTGLSSIPEAVFSSNTKAESFYGTFKECANLTTVPENLFASNNAVTDFSFAFYVCTGITGNVPELWATHSETEQYTDVFYGCTNAANYADIPADWR